MIYLIFILGFLIRLVNLNQSLWLDEAITAVAIKNNSYLDLLTKFAPSDFHPPLHYLILKFLTTIFGNSEIILRSPSVISSLATGAFVFLIAKKLFTKKVALIATLFWMLNPLSIYYSQEARMYSLATFGIAGAVYFLLKKSWFWYVVFFALAVWSDYLPALMLPVFVILGRNRKTLLGVLPLLIVFPLFWVQFQSGLQVSNSNWASVLGQFEFKSLPLTIIKFSTGRIPAEIWMAGILTFYAFLLLRTRSKLLWLWLTIPIFLGLLTSIIIPIYSYFRFLFVLPSFVMLLALGTKSRVWAVVPVVAISIFCLAVFTFNPELQRENWRMAAAYINSDPGEVIFPNEAQNAPFKYYQINQNGKPKYLMRYVQEIFDPKDFKRLKLENSGYEKIEERGFNGVLIWKYISAKN